MLDVRGLDAGYGEAQVLWEISLVVNEGEIVALVGANGAGKSTLLATISGLVQPSAGQIAFAGTDIAGWTAERVVAAGISHVPQGRRLFGGLTVLDNLLMGAFHRSDGGIAGDIERIYALFPRLRERSSQLAGTLSGGEQQMCAIGRGLMAKPKLLLVDELSLGLAPIVVEQLLAVLSSLRSEGMTIVLVEQDVQVALESADRGYVIENGRISLAGKAADVLADPHVKTAYLGL
ncbi:MAG: ABC transporter ATP-binding protein [Candidatus Eremiobacteraeota bacterium]|nr:ABC transporter ATP-binding protein [Candidatus Eremiobacteraeota bacterium]MBV8365248.1 ABC transporter ATP-binding protein [Candidatus Eremiobacteraeota bacterium]